MRYSLAKSQVVILIIRQIQEKDLAANKPVYTCPQKSPKRLIQSMYSDFRNRMRVRDEYSVDFGVIASVHLGFVLSLLLFIIVLKALSREFNTVSR